MADVYTKTKRSQVMARVRNKRTAAEDEVARLLRELNVRYRRNVKSLVGEPDLVIPSAKTAIFVHGCFWHNHKNCPRGKLPDTNRRFWKDKIEGNRRRDARVARALRGAGWRVITVWQCQLRDRGRVSRRLKRMLRR